MLAGEPLEHVQELDIRHAVHRRRTVYRMPGSSGGGRVTVSMERFCSAKRLHLLAGRVSVQCSEDCELLIRTGIDGDVWDINGPHLAGLAGADAEGCLLLAGRTQELLVPVAVAEAWAWAGAGEPLAGLRGQKRQRLERQGRYRLR